MTLTIFFSFYFLNVISSAMLCQVKYKICIQIYRPFLRHPENRSQREPRDWKNFSRPNGRFHKDSRERYQSGIDSFSMSCSCEGGCLQFSRPARWDYVRVPLRGGGSFIKAANEVLDTLLSAVLMGLQWKTVSGDWWVFFRDLVATATWGSSVRWRNPSSRNTAIVASINRRCAVCLRCGRPSADK